MKVLKSKIKIVGINDLKEYLKDNVVNGQLNVYDITHKYLNDEARKKYHINKSMGHSIVFSYNNRNKILIYNS